MADIAEIFGEEKLSYEEFRARAGQRGIEMGDVGAIRQEYEAEISSMKIDAAVEREMEHSGVKNRALVSKLLDRELLTLDEDGIHGITEQLAALKESDPYLFDGAHPMRPIRSGLPHSRERLNPDAMSDADYYKTVRKI